MVLEHLDFNRHCKCVEKLNSLFMSRVGVFVDDVCRRDGDVLCLGRSWFRKELRFLLL